MERFENALATLLLRVQPRPAGVLSTLSTASCTARKLWLDPRLGAAYACVLSLLLLGVAWAGRQRRQKREGALVLHGANGLHAETATLWQRTKEYVKKRGGAVIFAFHFVRLLSSATLLGLEVAVMMAAIEQGQDSTEAEYAMGWFSMACGGWAEVAVVIAYAYATVMSLLPLTLKGQTRRACSIQAWFILIIQFLVFGYRNLLPLTTFTGIPADGNEPGIMWARGTLVTLVGVVMPLVIPTEYVPRDPTNPASVPSPEQTASLLSFVFFIFLEPLVFAAYRVPQLPYDELPSLPDTDWSVSLAQKMEMLDPVVRRKKGLKDRHLFFGLMEVFRWEYIRMSCFMTSQMILMYTGPIGMNRLLNYLENDGKDAVVRPWVWIAFIFFSPMSESILFNMYIFTTTRMVVHCENLLTQLIFKHALRMRVTEEKQTRPTPPATPAEPVTPSEAAGSTSGKPAASTTTEHSPEHEGGSTDGSDNVTLVATEAGSSATAPVVPPPAQDKNSGTSTPTETSAKPAPPKPTIHMSGRINNLVGTDLGNLVDGRDFLIILIGVPLEIILGLWFLYAILGWAALVGLAWMIITFPLPTIVAKWINDVQKIQMQKTDARITAITESMNTIRMIKMFGWENLIEKQLADLRNAELEYTRKRKLLGVLVTNINSIIPLINMVIVYAVYSLVMKKELDAARIFSSIPVFDKLKGAMFMGVGMLMNVIKSKVSLDRVSAFVLENNLLDKYESAEVVEHVQLVAPREVIGFHNALFTWAKKGTTEIGERNFRLQIDDLLFKDDTVNLIVGPTGCGKTSILMALLGEMHFDPSGLDAWYSLPRHRGVAYAAQESWVQNDTIKNNILFGEAFEEDRYKKVLYQCGLLPDLKLFAAGDNTEVGEKGLTLSGGQKARVTLARAIYSHAGILLLDDVLSALDVHTARWVVDKCFQGDLVKGRTVLLVTHAVALAGPISGHVVSLDAHGHIISQGPLESNLSKDPVLRKEMKEDAEVLEADDVEEIVDAAEPGKPKAKASGKLVVEEEMAEGRLGWPAIKMIAAAYGGPLFWTTVFAAYFAVQVTDIGGTWWLGVWSSAYEGDHDVVPVVYYLSMFVLIVLVQTIVYAGVYLFYTLVSVEACRKVHESLSHSVLGATLRWMDTTPQGRIISRFTQDIREVDGPLSGMIPAVISMTVSLIMKFTAVVVMSPPFVIPAVAITAAGWFLGQVYIAAQMTVKRLRSNWKSPLYNHFAAAVNGIVSIRAYGAETSFQVEINKRLDAYSRPSRTFYNLNRWIATRADLLGAFLSTGLAVYLLYAQKGKGTGGAGRTGFSLTMAIEFAGMILWWVRIVNSVEVSGNSLERIRDYVVVEQEPVATEKGKPPAYWPASGSIRAENLCAKYSKDGPLVLENINFDIKSGERVGIVGRTGSGKSSLALSLLRLIPTTGAVYVDGLPTHEINLESLRTNLTIIPQEPMLISGSLRSNLDPFSEHDDAVLYDALRAAGLVGRTDGHEGTDLSLDDNVTSGGTNFSVGQRQLIALARAIVRRAKVLILDEATASVDADTDTVIQHSIREELKHATLITIAHRLQTIMDYDKIIVLDAGKLTEFDTPLALLENEKSMFRALVDESGHSEKLWDLARTGRV